tara:strand:- start:277 stop:996 length:720 start_codon:yes stop_codon:yes gene_type:complete
MPWGEKLLFVGTVTLAVLIARGANEIVSLQNDAPQVASLVSDATLPTASPPVAPALLTTSTKRTGYLHRLSACKGLPTSWAPDVDRNRRVTDFKPVVIAEGKVALAAAPVSAGCWSSAFGPRNGRPHKGVDYHSKAPVDIYAAADGTIREETYRDDYGNMIVIDHGHGVFTRYAHLQGFGAFGEGDTVSAGEVIGVMGNTANYPIPRHLHYEILTGEWGEQAGSFALTPVDVMGLPEAE